MLTAAERRLRASLAAHVLHGSHDSRDLTARARAALDQKFLDQVDPSLPMEERLRRAEHLKSAHFARLAFLRAKQRRQSRRLKYSRAKNLKRGSAAAGQLVAAAPAREEVSRHDAAFTSASAVASSS